MVGRVAPAAGWLGGPRWSFSWLALAASCEPQYQRARDSYGEPGVVARCLSDVVGVAALTTVSAHPVADSLDGLGQLGVVWREQVPFARIREELTQ